jgi:hypothetical protein
MFPIVFLSLFIAVVLIAAVGVVALLHEAFQPITISDGTDQADMPILCGDDLRAWAEQRAFRLVSTRARQARSGLVEPSTLAMVVEDTLSRVIARVFPPHRKRYAHSCTMWRDDVIPVTAPEVLAIAETLRQRFRPRTVETIAAKARQNLQVSQNLQHKACLARAHCPLSGAGGCCVAYASRPLYCRGRDACISMRSAADGDTAGANANVHGVASILSEGMLWGTAMALRDTGYDGQIYELSSSLAVALETPTASQRWAAGEAVFAGCSKIEPRELGDLSAVNASARLGTTC